MAFDPTWLRRLGVGDAARLSLIRVEGDSMAPTLSDGDEILVDGGDAAEPAARRHLRASDRRRAGGEAARARPGASGVSVRSDNEAYPGWPDCELSAIDLVGRVVWSGRRIK